MIYTSTLPSRTVRVNTEDWLWFSGTSYLGIGHNASFRQLLFDGLAQYGTNFGSSRNNNLRLQIYEEAEATLAQFAQAPAALTVSSGMLAGQIVMQYLANELSNPQIFYAPAVHPALWSSNYQPATESASDWFEQLPKRITHSSATHCVIVTDSVGSPRVAQMPLNWPAELPENKQITIVVDDSHGFGVFGDYGEGIYNQLAQYVAPYHKVIVVASMNKALGVPSGAILTDAKTIAAIRQTPMFSGSSPAVPAYLYAFEQAKDLYKVEHQKMLANTRYFAEKIKDLGLFDFFEDYPAFCTQQEGFHDFLKTNNILTASFPYPTPQDKPVTRLVITSLHQPEDLDTLVRCCHDFLA